MNTSELNVCSFCVHPDLDCLFFLRGNENSPHACVSECFESWHYEKPGSSQSIEHVHIVSNSWNHQQALTKSTQGNLMWKFCMLMNVRNFSQISCDKWSGKTCAPILRRNIFYDRTSRSSRCTEKKENSHIPAR